jgi:cytochrome c oxidase subunit 2
MSGWGLLPAQASTIAPEVDALYFFLIGVSLFFSLLIAGLLLRFMIAYRRRAATDVPPLVHGSLALEGAWTAIPFAIVMVVFVWGARIFAALHDPPADALEIHAVGKQWMWKLQHLEGKREINELHIPVGRPVKLTMTSEDVIHSFYVPAFRTKQDVIPGRYTTTWFEATRPGTYHLFCAEYCGTLHSGMIGRVVAMEPAAFQAWLAGAEPSGATVPVVEAGAALFAAQGCASCHAPGVHARAPELQGLFGTTVQFRDGSAAVADENYLRESIVDAGKRVVAGFDPIMPTYQGLLSEEQILQLVAYLKSLQTEKPS